MSPAIGEFAVIEAHRLREVNTRLIFALQAAREALDAALGGSRPVYALPVYGLAYCPRCDQVVRTIDDGETCAQCKLVL